MNAAPVELTRPAKLPADRPILFEVHQQLDAGGTADAYRMYWDGSDYVADESVTYEVRDLTKRNWGVEGERILCRPIRMPDDAALVWEVESGGAPWYEGTLDGALTNGGTADATVSIHGEDRTVEVADRFLSAGGPLAAAGRIGFVYDLQAKRFVVTEAPC